MYTTTTIVDVFRLLRRLVLNYTILNGIVTALVVLS